jgi:phospholipid/cholesterol/gamma-HCH transport system substrate-binding protein
VAKESIRNIKLGILVVSGIILLITALYMIGNKRNLFGSTFRINAIFYNINGLMEGHNVRFSGINVGTVENVEITSDTSVLVSMVIENKVQKYIKKNAIASIGSDGLMGNKLVNIVSLPEYSEIVSEGDVIQGLRLIEMDEAMRTLNTTNENLKGITINLNSIFEKINRDNSLWHVLMDTVLAEDVKTSIRFATNQTALITADIRNITRDIKDGKGSLGSILADTLLAEKISSTIMKIENFSDTATIAAASISGILAGIQQGKGSIGVLINDTSLIYHLSESLINIEKGTELLNEDLEALKQSWPFKKYFQEKKKTKKLSHRNP